VKYGDEYFVISYMRDLRKVNEDEELIKIMLERR
jgi:hypothetical protein